MCQVYVVPSSVPIDIDQHMDKSLIIIINKWFPRVKRKYILNRIGALC